MNNLGLFTKLVGTLEGLNVSLKVEKGVTELSVKGDALKIMQTVGEIVMTEQESENAKEQIEELKKKVLD